MKKATRFFGLLLVLVLFAAMALGSGSSKPSTVKPPASVSGAGESATNKPSNRDTAPATEQVIAPTEKDVTIEEAVIFEQDGIRITVKGFDAKSLFGPEIKLLIENDSEKSVTVQSRNTSVNGYMIGTMMSTDVAPGKKANDELTLMRSDLEAAGITTIADVEFSFHIFDSETWDTIYDSKMIRLETSAASGYVYTFDNSGNLAYNENGVEIVVKGLMEGSSFLGPEVVVYIANTGDHDVTVQVRDVSINGFMVQSVFSCDVLVGKHAVDTITFLSSDLEKNGIESISNLELSFHIFDMNSWDTIADTAPITISFE